MTLNLTSRRKSYVVIVADDMGKSISVNQAIAEAHDRGFLTAASVMAGGDAFDDAARIIAARSWLSAGLHVTLCDGKAVLPHACVPDITDAEGNFVKDPFTAGLRYTRPGFLAQIEAEVAAQFERLERAGIQPSHVDCHHHLHMHPRIFEVICRQAFRRNISWIRLPGESLSTVMAFRSPLRGIMPFIEWAVFGTLGKYNARTARKYKMQSAARVYGLSNTGGVDEKFFLDILRHTGDGLTEIFTHPDTATVGGRRELAALVSPAVQDLISALQIAPAGYKDFPSQITTIMTKRSCGENLYSDITGNLECRNR